MLNKMTAIGAALLWLLVAPLSSTVSASSVSTDVVAPGSANSTANLNLTPGTIEINAQVPYNFKTQSVFSTSTFPLQDQIAAADSFAPDAIPDRVVTVTDRTGDASVGWTMQAKLDQFQYNPDQSADENSSGWQSNFDGITSLNINSAVMYQGGLVSDGNLAMSKADSTTDGAPNAFTGPIALQPGAGTPTTVWTAAAAHGLNAWSLLFDTDSSMTLTFPMANQLPGTYRANLVWTITKGPI